MTTLPVDTKILKGPKNYRVRVMDHGEEYKVKLSALLALRCLDDDPKEFWIANNVWDCRFFDDIVIYRESSDNKTTAYMIQAKHRKYPRCLKDEYFQRTSGAFSLKKYVLGNTGRLNRSIDESDIGYYLNKVTTTYRVIFLNRSVDEKSTLNKSVITNLDLELINCGGRALSPAPLFQSEEPVQNLYLLVDQPQLFQLDKEISKAIGRLVPNLSDPVSNEVVSKFVYFVQRWSKGHLGGHYLLEKDEIVNALTEFMLESRMNNEFYRREFPRVYHYKKISKWENITNREKTITIINMRNANGNGDVLDFLFAHLDGKIRDTIGHRKSTRWLNEFSENQILTHYVYLTGKADVKLEILRTTGSPDKITLFHVYKALWKLKMIPLMLNVHGIDDYVDIGRILKLSNYDLKAILLNYGENVDLAKLDLVGANLFATLTDLSDRNYKEMLREHVKFQGKPLQLKCLLEDCDDLKGTIDARSIIDILNDSYDIGERLKALPKYYVKRTGFVFINFHLAFETIDSTNDLYVIQYENDKYHQLLQACLRQYRFRSDDLIRDYAEVLEADGNLPENCRVILFRGNDADLSSLNLEKPQGVDGVHYLKFLNKAVLKLVKTSNPASILKFQQSQLSCILTDDFVVPTPIPWTSQNLTSQKKEAQEQAKYGAILKTGNTVTIVKNWTVEKIGYHTTPDELSRNEFKSNTNGIYYLRNHDTGIELIGSFHSFDEAPTFAQSSTQVLFLNEEAVIPRPGEVRIITGSPGIGKTVEIDCIAQMTPPTFWVLKIELRLYMDYYRSEEFQNASSEERLRYFNREIQNRPRNSSISERVFEICLGSNRVLLLIDGLDEISPAQKVPVTNMIRAFKMDQYRIWLTTRPILKSYAERIFETVARVLPEFSESDQLDFLNHYFSRNHAVQNVTMECFTMSIRDTINSVFSHYKKPLMGIPLQIKLIAEFFESHCVNYFKPNFSLKSNGIAIRGLCEMFINKKIEILDSKYGSFASQMNSQYDYVKNLFALQYISKFCSLPDIKTLLRDVITVDPELVQKDGILATNDEATSINFVDQMFAEYYVANWISKNNTNLTAESIIALDYGIINKISNEIDLNKILKSYCQVLDERYTT